MPLNSSYNVSLRMEAKRNGVFYKSVNAVSASLKMVMSAELKISMTAVIQYDPDLDLINDRFVPYQIVDGLEYRLGEFIVSTASEHLENNLHTWEIECYDQTVLIQRA